MPETDPFASPDPSNTGLFTASYAGECVFGCDIEVGDQVAYVADGLVCEYHYELTQL